MIALKNVSKTYGQESGQVVAVDEVSLDLGASPYTAIMGPSGCGKSTLLAMAGGLQPPDAGVVHRGSEDVYALSDNDLHAHRRRFSGFVFQDYNLVPILTVEENVALPLELEGVSRKEARRRAAELITRVGLDGLNDRLPSTLSGGQAQRVAVARGVVAGQRILLADEPTGALDSGSAEQLMRVFDEVVASGTVVVVVTHSESVAERAHRVVHMRDGRLESVAVA